MLINDPGRFDGVRVLGVYEHVWIHTRRSDLTPIRDGTRRSRVLDMFEGRSKATFKAWLAEQDKTWRDGVEVVAMDGSTGFNTTPSDSRGP